MAIIKKGATGSAVEEVQKLLNKFGTKPALKIDGIFGKLTDKAVRASQKKLELKADGKVGELTLAALKYGGALPEMTVSDYVEWTKELQKSWLGNQQNVQRLLTLNSEIASLNSVWSKEIPEVDQLFIGNYKHWQKVAELCEVLIKKQKEFSDLRLKDPKKAQKLATECEALDKQIDAIGVSKISPNQIKANKLIKAARKKLTSSMKAIEKELDAIAHRP